MLHCNNLAAPLDRPLAQKHLRKPWLFWRGFRLTYITLAIAATTASMFLAFNAATQMRPESTP